MLRRELKLRECPTDIKIMIKHMGYSIPNNFWQNEFCSDPLATYFGLSRTLLKLAEYATDMEVIVREVIWAFSSNF